MDGEQGKSLNHCFKMFSNENERNTYDTELRESFLTVEKDQTEMKRTRERHKVMDEAGFEMR